MPGGPHVLQPAAVHQVHFTSTQAGHLHRHVDGRVARTEYDAAFGQGQLRQVIALAQFADIVGGGQQAGCVFVGQPQLSTGRQTDPQKHRIELQVQFAQGEVAAQSLAVTHLDATDLQHEVHFTLGKIVHQFVFGDPVLIEATGFVVGLKDHHFMPEQGQAMGAGQPGRARPDYGDALAGGGCPIERVFVELRVVDRITLQQAD